MSFFDGIPWGALFNGGGWTIAFATVVQVARLVYRGDLVPRSAVEGDRKALAAEREVNKELRSALVEQAIPLARLSAHSLQAIRSDTKDGDHE